MNQGVKNIITIVAVAIGLLLAWQLKTIIGYVLISLVLALIGRPIMQLLKIPSIKGKKLPNGFMAAVTLLILFIFFSGIFSLFIPLVMEEARILSSINFEHVAEGLQEPINDCQNWLHNNHLMNPKNNLEDELLSIFSFTQVGTLFSSIFGMLGNSLISLFSILFITFFLLKEKYLANRVITAFTPENKQGNINNILKNTKELLSRYFIGIIIQIAAITIIVSTGLSFLGIQHVILIGFLAGVINVIPYVGPVIGGLIGVLIGISTNLQLEFYTELLPLSGKIFLVFATMQLIDNFMLQPLIFSNSVKAHPLEIFIVVLSAGTIWGITGMIVAIPFYTLFRVVAKEFLSEFKVIEQLTKNL
ncbi:MAG: AI-2E family transporter [Flavobacteriales bacterium]|nr:AI-2E family transporter [Flavobacteriales bacterium]|tara:strand:+ start:14792 stop:15874 length:1083 start_codon:yes stop_codon:yes gene_type:complete